MFSFYGKVRPEVGDYVVSVVDRIEETVGYFARLPEYQDIEAFVGIREMTRVRYKKLRSIIRVGTIEVLEVVNIDDKYIDCTRKHLNEEEIQICFDRYRQYKKIYDWLLQSGIFNFHVVREYVETVLHEGNAVPPHLQELHLKVLDLQTTAIKTVLSAEIFIKELKSADIPTINAHLSRVRLKFDVDVTTVNTRTSAYLITYRRPISECESLRFIDAIRSEPVTQEAVVDQHFQPVPVTEYSMQPVINVGIIGHVAHGKTTLVQALTNVDTRRHKREIQSNRTLRLGYTNVRITKCTCSGTTQFTSETTTCGCSDVYISIVDCPGHNVLLSTMISGAHLMDVYVVVVAANEDCPQPQTKEHVDVMQVVGKSQAVAVAQNKLDLVDADVAQKHQEDIQTYLNSADISTPVIPLSAQKSINVEKILEILFNCAKAIPSSPQEDDTGESFGIVVRTFDVNRPGKTDVKGLVVGGSVISGRFSAGDDILLMPLFLRTKIISIKSDMNFLDKARPGGLVAFETDLNPAYCDALIGSTYMPTESYNEKRHIRTGTELRMKHYLLPKVSNLKKGDRVGIMLLAQPIEAIIVKVYKLAPGSANNRCLLRLSSDIYLHDNAEFTIIKHNRLIGCGRFVDYFDGSCKPRTNVQELPLADDYAVLLQKYEVESSNMATFRTALPVPKCVYSNTYTTVTNFAETCGKLNSRPYDVGLHIFTESGSRSWSLNGGYQLILKGRFDDRKVMNMLIPFIRRQRCCNCKSFNTESVIDRRVRKQKCKLCGWSEVKQSV